MDIYINDLPEKTNMTAKSLPRTTEDTEACGGITLPVPRGGVAAVVERLLSLLDRLIDALSSSGVLRAVRVIVSVVCFFAVLGIIGGIEHGALDWKVGVAATLATATLEALCLRKCR
ncbi:MAG: hypothetical protein GX057_07335 [Clostridiales bacterium]|nr:hypothetical protein [Clostridiales bacterium]HOA84904.1 hypothetical protein [Bacillota bacterium]